MSEEEETEAPKRRGGRPKGSKNKKPAAAPRAQMYPKGFPTNENGEPGDLSELNENELRELGVFDSDSARMLQMARDSTNKKAHGETGIHWHPDDDWRFTQVKRLYPGCTVKFKRTEPQLDQSLQSRPLQNFASYDQMVRHLRDTYWRGEQAKFLWWIGDGTIPSRTSGEVVFAYDPNYGQAVQQAPPPQEEPTMTQNPNWPWGPQPPGYGPPSPYGALPQGGTAPWGGTPPWMPPWMQPPPQQQQSQPQAPIFVMPPQPPPQQPPASGQPQAPAPQFVMMQPPPSSGDGGQVVSQLFSMNQHLMSELAKLNSKQSASPEADQMRQALTQIQWMMWQMMQPKPPDAAAAATPPVPAVPPPDPMVEIRKSMDLFTMLTTLSKKAADALNPNPLPEEKPPGPDAPLVVQDAGPVRFGYERGPDGALQRLEGFDRFLINGDKAKEGIKGFGDFVKDLFDRVDTMRTKDSERSLNIEREKRQQLEAVERLEKLKVQPTAQAALPPPPPVTPPQAPPQQQPPQPPRNVQPKQQSSMQSALLQAMRTGVVIRQVDTTGEEAVASQPTPPTPPPPQKEETKVEEAPTDPAPPPEAPVAQDVAPPPTTD